DWGQFAITLSEPAPENLRVGYGISGKADPGKKNDYLLKDGRKVLGDDRRNNTIVVGKGERRVLIDVVPLGDRDYTEGDEEVILRLENGNGYIVGKHNKDTVTIEPYAPGGRRRGG
ncbi:MAG: hypothetical protein VKL39_00220, partial [Leptolyngbyaceae bacterium]|nr:hypothetical protein [Leptolyngbyaceae bacterium]